AAGDSANDPCANVGCAFAAPCSICTAMCRCCGCPTAARCACDDDASPDAIPDVPFAEDSSKDAPKGEANDASGCPGASYTTAPSGAPCDPSRILRGGGLVAWYCGPDIGASCDELSVGLASDEMTPPGFRCGSAELGVRQCDWIFDGDASFGYIDKAALEAACAVTAAFPGRNVNCKVTGS